MSLEDLIAAERSRPVEPSADEAKAIWKRIRGGTGAVVPPMFDVSPATTVVTLKMKVAAALSTAVGKVVVGTAVVGTLAGGTAAVVTRSQEPAVSTKSASKRAPAKAAAPEPEQARSKPAPEVVPVPVPVAVPVPEVVPEVVRVPEVPTPEVATPKRESKRRAKPEPSTFGGELELIKQAQRALGSNQTDAALAALADHERKFPNGSMMEDRLALRALALCKAGRHEEGRRAATLLERKFPRSLYAERVNEKCS